MMEEERLQQQIGEQKRVQAEFLETEHPHVEDVKRLGQEMLAHCYTPHGGSESENVRALTLRAGPDLASTGSAASSATFTMPSDPAHTIRNWLSAVDSRWTELVRASDSRASALKRELDSHRRNMQQLGELLEWESGSLNTLQLASRLLLPQTRPELVQLMADHKVCVLASHSSATCAASAPSIAT